MTLTSAGLTAEKYDRRMARISKNLGEGGTDFGRSLIYRYLKETKDNLSKTISNIIIFKEITYVDLDILAMTCLHTAISCVSLGKHKPSEISFSLGRAIEDEVYAYLVNNHDAVLAKRVQAIVKRNASITRRRKVLRSEAAKLGLLKQPWCNTTVAKVGGWALGVLTSGSLFVINTGKRIGMAPEALEMAKEAAWTIMGTNPTLLPRKTPCDPWTGLVTTVDGYRLNLVKTFQKPVMHVLAGAIKDGRMAKVLEAVNHAQGTTWRINRPIVSLVEWCYNNNVEVSGLPPKRDLARGHVDDTIWESYDSGQRMAHHRASRDLRQRNTSFIGERYLLKQALDTADYLGDEPFWTPLTMDYRGRVYNASSFGFQRQDYVRGMMEFASGEVLTPEGLWWLKVHVANTGAFDKIDKQSFQARVNWVDTNGYALGLIAEAPECCPELWIGADSPFMFVAACRALWDAYNGYPIHLPVSFDGTCSGLQHLSAMTRDASTAALVNLTPTEAPCDIYTTVATIAEQRCKEDAKSITDCASVATVCHSVGVSRTLVKRNVMTYSYSSKVYGMRQQHMEDTMEPLGYKVLAKEIEVHPYSHPSDTFQLSDGTEVTRTGRTAAAYLATTIHGAIREVVELPALAMDFLIDLSKCYSHEGKPVLWHTPLGMPVMLRYPLYKSKQVELFLLDRGIKIPHSASARTEAPGIDKRACANAISPSFVHSLDACHLHMVCLYAKTAGIMDIALVHDSFGCHPNRASDFRKVILEAFEDLYNHDVLADFRQEALTSLNDTSKVPQLPTYGDLDITQVLDAEYAFA